MDMKGKVCMITGATSGIGWATALGLARLGATTVIVCRDRAKSEAAVAQISNASGNESVHLLVADLSSQQSVREMARDFTRRFCRLDVLVNNAGAYATRRHVTVDGIETTFAVNYLARFLLTNLLLDTLKDSSPARIIDVAGAYHRRGMIDFQDLQGERHYSGGRANSQSKLANILFTYELSRRLDGTGVTANCLHPGAVATSLIEKDRDCPGHLRLLCRLFKPFFKSIDKGAETSIYLASAPEVEGVSGKYFVNRKAIRSSETSYDESLGKALWDVSLRLTNWRGN